MSPVNSDDPAGEAFGAAGGPLTRKEIRARQHQGTPGHDDVPAQDSGTGGDVPAAPARAAGAPEQPPSAPTVHQDQAPDGLVSDEQIPAEQVSDEQLPAEQVAEEQILDDPDYGFAGGVFRDDADQADAGIHADAAEETDEARYVYHDPDDSPAEDHHEEDGRVLLAGGSAIPNAKAASRKVRRRRRVLALLLTLSVFIVALVVGAQFLKPLLGGDTLADYPGPGTGEVRITVPPGAGPKAVATELQEKKVVANADTFLRDFLASGGALAPGDFTMRNEMKNSDAVAVLLNRGQDKVIYFALSAGLRIGESLQAISEGTGVPVAQLRELSDSPQQFGVPDRAQNLEGFLAPGEHRFPLGTPARDVLQKLVTTTLDELTAQGVTDPEKQYDVITVASIVQAEGGQAEYGDVAGAIYNRLKPDNIETNGLIQSDATVTYGLGIKSFHIDEAQKADKSNPYNTYANQGLPVGPIGSPGKTAIDAAAKPKANDYLYWVTINLDTKETLFSKTLAEHNTYVARYNAWCQANPGRCV